MPSGTFAGGFTQGLGNQLQLNQQADIADKTLAIHKGTLDLATKKNSFDQFKEMQTAYHAQLAETAKSISEFSKEASAKGIDVETDPKAQQYIGALAQSFETARQVAQQAGFQGSDPGYVASRFKMAASAGITPEQKGAGEVRGKVAGAQAASDVTGQPIEKTLAGAGVIPTETSQPVIFVDQNDSKKIIAQGTFDKSSGTYKTSDGHIQPAGTMAMHIPTIQSSSLGDVSNTSKKAGEAFAKTLGDMAVTSQSSALGAIDQIDTISRIRKAVDSGNIIVGPGANVRLVGAQLAQIAGLGGKDTIEQLQNTRNVIKGMAEFALSARKQLKGQGQVSDYEGRLLQKASAGEINDLTVPEIKVVLDVTERLGKRQYNLHKQFLKNMQDNPSVNELTPFFDVPPLPDSKAAPSITPEQALAELKRRGKAQ